MPGPAKKETLSADVAKILGNHAEIKAMGTKAGNKDWSSSSFYVPKKINLRFNNAINTLKAYGYEVDRSDLLSAFMDRFAETVRSAEDNLGDGDELDLKALLETATGTAGGDLKEVSTLRQSMAETLKLANGIADNAMELSQAQNDRIAMLLSLLPEDAKAKLDPDGEMVRAASPKIQEAMNAAYVQATDEQIAEFEKLMAAAKAKLGEEA